MARKGVYDTLIGELARLPGVGRRNAQRLAYAIMGLDEARARRLGDAIVHARTQARACERCNNVSDRELCEVCANPRRDAGRLMVVEDPGVLYQVEHTGTYRGLYHVLAAVLTPLTPTDPKAVHADALVQRVRDGEVREVILATSPTVEGEATALYLTRELKPLGVTISRIAYGVPVGMELEFADEVSLIKAIEGRYAM